jgi:N-acetylglutamate synthase/N-acetylornithine aminotransferase
MTLGPGVRRTALPKGFLASGINCGVRRYRPDMGLLLSEVPAVAAGVFTQSTLSRGTRSLHASTSSCRQHLSNSYKLWPSQRGYRRRRCRKKT